MFTTDLFKIDPFITDHVGYIIDNVHNKCYERGVLFPVACRGRGVRGDRPGHPRQGGIQRV